MMENKFKRMLCSDRSFQVNQKKPFKENVEATKDDVQKCLEFCWNMTYGNNGEHRDHRSGGEKRRNQEEIFQDIFIGKMGEIAFYRWCQNRQKAKISEVDFTCFKLGKWDSSDFTITANEKVFKVAVKTTKFIGNLLLLEMKDWKVIDKKAIYIPNQLKDDDGFYHYLVFCRVKTNLGDLLTKFNGIKQVSLSSLAESLTVGLQVVGYINNNDLVNIMSSGKYEIYQGDILNKKTRMDADNYYIQSGAFSD